MVQKRPLSEELYEALSKQPKLLEPSDKRVSVLEFPDGNIPPKLHILGEDGAACDKKKGESDESLVDSNLAEFQSYVEKEIDRSLACSISNSSWATSTTCEEDVRSGAPCILLSPNHYNLDFPARTIFHTGDIYSSLLEYPPRKLVPIGSGFQAEIPEWCGCDDEKLSSSSGDAFEVFNRSSQSLMSDIGNHLDHERQFSGSCLVPMPRSDMSEDTGEKLGDGRIDCSCDDVGSVRCVRQHITEAREKLRKTLGQEAFVKLGFLEMGEVVAEKWSEEEEEIFAEVVFSHPASLGRNFWNHSAIEFPSRTKKEIVSYYFNVFMLRRRAEQNRIDVLSIDSDNDEWEGTNVSADEVIEKINGYDDSVVESPAEEDDHNEIFEDNLCEYKDDINAEEASEDNIRLNLDGSKCVSKESDMPPIDMPDNCSSDQAHQPLDQVLSDISGNQNTKHITSNLSSMSSSTGNELFLEPCSSKEWDVGCLTCPKDEDFLPTSSVIEEVFGAGAWNSRD
ncbi:AT-rich interactive domain-containing protein 1-like isoform X1 [Coffea eugenioides]|uniref:AT-rich interactive domain-containing protein 1-like isoform X1 n=1 Tax=Coffea arabica TaxID=13443 RepID=A0A6P6XIR1_COFAR|nr:AT-rich interactive domain-containing protein 1-like isoform X1 [Coffea arabica]XP_027126820.1 AT-rich interactive domain-containing protein 1-like isoform X1 [Coffea arabica]XP_027126821.1 AT-rich interactive domain-containing protein 1-like isoform X1 [Coffea arabica]XP_027168786.1 AT-rich interactive domain-containing protein 1-like isoform X1 [Coffea eugenioides]XP_027168787.1 AT-rich interactive domain-containing protein 1-like isoform X1 [Coffea eugenioides]XP_027168788.1 AT-rich inte